MLLYVVQRNYLIIFRKSDMRLSADIHLPYVAMGNGVFLLYFSCIYCHIALPGRSGL